MKKVLYNKLNFLFLDEWFSVCIEVSILMQLLEGSDYFRGKKMDRMKLGPPFLSLTHTL